MFENNIPLAHCNTLVYYTRMNKIFDPISFSFRIFKLLLSNLIHFLITKRNNHRIFCWWICFFNFFISHCRQTIIGITFKICFIYRICHNLYVCIFFKIISKHFPKICRTKDHAFSLHSFILCFYYTGSFTFHYKMLLLSPQCNLHFLLRVHNTSANAEVFRFQSSYTYLPHGILRISYLPELYAVEYNGIRK